MSKLETDLPERLSAAGASPLEQRLLQAAGSELPSLELSERMARAIGVTVPAGELAGGAGGAKPAVATSKAVSAGNPLMPWVTGALVAVAVAGGFVATRTKDQPPAGTAPAAAVAPAASPVVTPATGPASSIPDAAPLAPSPAKAEDDEARKVLAPPTSARTRSAWTSSDLAGQIALVDSARAALAVGSAAKALDRALDYQSEYPNGAFRPEVAAIKIEALLKLGRKSEARALAERFTTSYGRGPLAERVARLVGAPEP